MLSNDFYFVDLNVVYTLLERNCWYIVKLLLVAYFIFYYLPSKIFPQEHLQNGIEKVVFNFIYMTLYAETVVPFLLFIKAFSLLLFLVILILTKFAFMKFYYKQNIMEALNNMRIRMMIQSLTFLDNAQMLRRDIRHAIDEKIVTLEHSFSLYSFLEKTLFTMVPIYILVVLISRGLLSYADPVPDTAQFMEWVAFLQQNLLYPAQKMSADFYGTSVIIFFVNVFTNIDQIILFSIYPLLLLIALYLSIYYILRDFTSSKYVALFGVMVHGMVLMSPLAHGLLGLNITTSYPDIMHLFGLQFYSVPKSTDIIISSNKIGFIPYLRYISGMAYEHSSVFVLLNAYFLIKTLQTHLSKYLLVYMFTLLLVFTFHGGGAIVLIFISILIALNALLFHRIDKKILKKGSLAIFIAAIFGNLWILSMLKYGIPQDFGAAAPILDKIIGTKKNIENMAAEGSSIVAIIAITKFHLALMVGWIVAFIFSFFTKQKFVNSSYLLIVLGIFILYFGPNAGLPLLVKQTRLGEYMFFGVTLLSAFYLFYFFYKPLFEGRKYAPKIVLTMFYILFILGAFGLPKWPETKYFWRNINRTQYTSVPEIILKINSENRPFTWTVIAYVQTYGKIKNKGYHINAQKFILKYNPRERLLPISTKKVFIFVENFPNAYRGLDEWFYRWRRRIQNNLKTWVTIYARSHSNIKVYAKTKTITVYEIDNSDYIKYLVKKGIM